MLETKLAGVMLRNPLILSAGFLGTNSQILKRVYDAGAGAVTTKSIGPKKREGNKSPIIVEYDCGLLNCVGLSCPDPKEAFDDLKNLDIPLIISLYGKKGEDYVKNIKLFSPVASLFELNVSCPNVKGKMIGKDAKQVKRLVSKAKKATKKKIFVKLTPNVSDIVPIAKAVERGGGDGITAINTVGPGMVIDIDAKKPVLSFKTGGVSGPGIKPLAVGIVYQIYEKTKLPIIGAGGVTKWQDAVEMALAGATGIGIGTGIMYNDLKIFRQINAGIEKYLRKNNYDSVGEIIGLAHG